jgi:hypothetical protein
MRDRQYRVPFRWASEAIESWLLIILQKFAQRAEANPAILALCEKNMRKSGKNCQVRALDDPYCRHRDH